MLLRRSSTNQCTYLRNSTCQHHHMWTGTITTSTPHALCDEREPTYHISSPLSVCFHYFCHITLCHQLSNHACKQRRDDAVASHQQACAQSQHQHISLSFSDGTTMTTPSNNTNNTNAQSSSRKSITITATAISQSGADDTNKTTLSSTGNNNNLVGEIEVDNHKYVVTVDWMTLGIRLSHYSFIHIDLHPINHISLAITTTKKCNKIKTKSLFVDALINYY